MLKTVVFFVKPIIFNTFFAILLLANVGVLVAQQQGHQLYGAAFEVNPTQEKPTQILEKLTVKDSLQAQITGTIKEVCQVKGCWMKVGLTTGEEVLVRFKDYGFFVPTNSSGKSVVMNGKAFIEEMSVEDQKHYAEDEGASEEEIKKITKPKNTYRFEADGVLINSKL